MKYFVSNFSLKNASGGWNGINFKMFDALKRADENWQYVGNISPKSSTFLKVISKVKRSLSIGGNFFYFSTSRLRKIKNRVAQSVPPKSKVLFFGATPWLLCENYNYSTYLDICFPGYIELYLGSQKFSKKDVSRISELEKKFLLNAKTIFWGSNWAKVQAESKYNCVFNNSVILTTGGHLPIPNSFSPKGIGGKVKLLFMSTNFAKKGGELAIEATKWLRKEGYNVELNIIGDPPSKKFATNGYNYHGYLHKDSSSDLNKMIDLIKKSHFLVHPTTMETMGAVIVEAGYYGVPTIAPDNFGIPDLITDNETGFLLELPLNFLSIVNHIKTCIENPELYTKISQQAYRFFTRKRSWEKLAIKIEETFVE